MSEQTHYKTFLKMLARESETQSNLVFTKGGESLPLAPATSRSTKARSGQAVFDFCSALSCLPLPLLLGVNPQAPILINTVRTVRLLKIGTDLVFSNRSN